MRLTLGTVFLCLLGKGLYGQSISGKVSDHSTGETLVGVNVVYGDGLGSVTDLEGKFNIEVTPGEHVLKFSYLGYDELSRSVTVSASESKTINAKLKPANQELDLVVVTGSQYEKKVSEELVTIDVLKNYLVENSNSTDLKDAIDKVPGVNIIDGQVSIRGGSGYSYGTGSRVQLLVDDVPLLSGDLSEIWWTYVPLEHSEQIEVVKGAASSLYGSGALNGVINVRTAWPNDKPETRVSIYQGIYTNPRQKQALWWDESFSPLLSGAFISHRQKFKNFDLVVGGNYRSDKTYLKTGSQQQVRMNFKTRLRDQKIRGLMYGINGNFQYQQQGRFILWENDTSGAYIPLEGTRSQDKYLFLNIDPYIQYAGLKGSQHKFQSRYYRVARHDPGDFEETAVSNLIYTEYRFQHRFPFKMTLNAGVSNNLQISYSNLYPGVNLLTNNPAIYTQIEKEFGNLNVLFGARTEWNINHGFYEEFSDPIVRAGLNYRAAKKTNIRTSFGQSYRFASLAEKYIEASLGDIINIRPNPTLSSEKGWTAELGIKQGFKISNWNGYADVAVFWLEFENMIEYVIDVDSMIFFQARNVGRARVAGLEVSLIGQGKIGPVPVRLFAGYTFNYPGDLSSDTAQRNVQVYLQNVFNSINSTDSLIESGSILKYRVRNVLKFDLEFDIGKFTLGYGLTYNSFMDRIDAYFDVIVPGITNYRSLNDKGILTMDARIGYRISKRSYVSIIGKNITNESVSLRPGILEAPRSFTIKYQLRI